MFPDANREALFFPQMKPESSAQPPVPSTQREQTGLSNKKWDKAIKGLTKNKVARVEKTDAGLLVSLI